MKLLIKHNALTNIRDENGRSPILYTIIQEAVYAKFIQNSAADIIQQLSSTGASINERDNFGRTPLFYVSEVNSIEGHRQELKRMMVLNGANVNP